MPVNSQTARSLMRLLLATSLFTLTPLFADSTPASKYGVTTLTPPSLKTAPSPKYWPRTRMWQGIPSITCTPQGRLWATWYCGPLTEGHEGNYATLVTSSNGGKTWSPPIAVYDPTIFFDGRTGDPHLWTDPQGKVWWFISRVLPTGDANGNRSSWAFKMKDCETSHAEWEDPVFVGYGIALNKAISLASGEWIQPVDTFNSKKPESRTQFYQSINGGKTFQYLSSANIPNVSFSEHMLAQKKDGNLRVLARTTYGIAQAESHDKGASWSNAGDFLKGSNINTRFHLAKLRSGAWLLIINDSPRGRKNLTALLSDDEGKSWPHKLILDERDAVSYPDAVQDAAENIYVIYDHGRYQKDQQEILLAKIAENDIRAGKVQTQGSFLKHTVDRLADSGGGVRENREIQNMLKKTQSPAKQEAEELK